MNAPASGKYATPSVVSPEWVMAACGRLTSGCKKSFDKEPEKYINKAGKTA
jgi:hypothetical protein